MTKKEFEKQRFAPKMIVHSRHGRSGVIYSVDFEMGLVEFQTEAGHISKLHFSDIDWIQSIKPNKK